MVTVYMVLWSHGNTVGGVFLFGHKASAGHAYRIAAAREARLTAA
jgi:hypothetical protein